MTNSDIIATSSSVIAIASLVVSVAGVWWARKSALRSMRPMLVGSNHREVTNGGKTYIYEFAIESVGAGPAMLRDVRLFFGKELFVGEGTYRDGPSELVSKCFPDGVWPNAKPGSLLSVEKNGMPSCKGALRPGDRFLFVRIRFDFDQPLSSESVRELEARFERPHYKVYYTSIYEEQVWVCEP